MAEAQKGAARPEDITRLFVERANARDAEGLAALYEPDAVLGYPPGQVTQGRDAILALYEQMVARGLRFKLEEAVPVVRNGDLALTATHRADGAGIRVQVVRRQSDGTWLRVIDLPEPPPPRSVDGS